MEKENSSIPLLQYADSFYSRHPKVEQQRVPTEATLELTKLCSLKCKHCYIGDGRWQKNPEEIATEEVLGLLDVLAERGTLWITFTGGEPLMRRDFPLLWKAAQEKGFLTHLFTNATLLTLPAQELLRQYKPTKVEVSIYGASALTYESLAQVPGSFPRFLAGVNFIQSLGVPWLLKAPVLRENLSEVSSLKEFAKSFGVPIHFSSAIQASTGHGETGGLAPCATRVSEEDAVQFDLADSVAKSDLKNHQNAEKKEGDFLFECGAGRNSFYITAEAEIQMCNMTTHRKRKLRDSKGLSDSFDQAWSAFGDHRKLLRSPDSPCFRCDIRNICQNCPGFSQLESGCEQGAVAWLCRQTHIKAKLLGMPHQCHESHFCRNSL